MNAKVKKYVVPNLPYPLIFRFFCKIGEAYRLVVGADFGMKLMGMMKTIGPAFGTIAPDHGFDLLVGLTGAVTPRLIVYDKVRNAKKFKKDAKYGSARWGTAKDIAPLVDPKSENNVILAGMEFLIMNTRPKIPANTRNLNCCIIGSSGSGKTRFWLTPQLPQAHSSYACVDPKCGVLSQVGHFLQKKKSYKIKVSNSIDFRRSMHYNPMAYIKMESGALKFVDALITNTKDDGKEGDEFWTKAETLLYCAPVAHIVFEGPEEERNMNTLVKMINSTEVREDDESFKNTVGYTLDGLVKRKPQVFTIRQHVKYKLASSKTSKSIPISCRARLAPLDIVELREIMSYDELEFDKLGNEKTALFFYIPDTDSTYNFIVAPAFLQMFNSLCKKANNVYGGWLLHHVRVLWDEAANTGQVPQLEKIVAVIHSREISLCLFYQAMSQCKVLYKDSSEAILGNMDSVIFLGGREYSTIREISEALGKETISMYTEGWTRGQSENYDQNLQRFGKELMTMDELITMSGNECILQPRSLRLFSSPRYDLRKHLNYKYMAEVGKKRSAFHLEKLISTRLKFSPNEEYEIYGAGNADSLDDDILNCDDLDDPSAFA